MQTNSLQYWNARFASGDWAAVGGPAQTREFAEAQVKYFGIGRDFSGSLLDFGCGQGDAFPIYRRSYPRATLIGADFSTAAIERCVEKYGELAKFVWSDHESCPSADVIVVSNVLEHLQNDIEVARSLLSKCGDLYVIVPYQEQYLIDEHVRRYTKSHFDTLRPKHIKVFASRGWSQYGLRAVWWEIRLKNLIRPLVGKLTLRRRLQVMFHFSTSA